MCKFFSGYGLRDGTIRYDPLLDGHTDLGILLGIPDGVVAHAVKFELTPPPNPADLFQIDHWRFRLDEESAPVWWDDVAERIERAARVAVTRMFVLDRTIPIITSGCYLVGPGGTVGQLIGGRVWSLHEGGTIQYVQGGTIQYVQGGTIQYVHGGTIQYVQGGTIQTVRGGTIQYVHGGTIQYAHGGTIQNVQGGTMAEVERFITLGPTAKRAVERLLKESRSCWGSIRRLRLSTARHWRRPRFHLSSTRPKRGAIRRTWMLSRSGWGCPRIIYRSVRCRGVMRAFSKPIEVFRMPPCCLTSDRQIR